SGPLTVYFGFKEILSLHIIEEEIVVIHIIAATSVHTDSLLAWEVLLHLVPEMYKLVIVMIGKELSDEPYARREQLCELCTAQKKELIFIPIPKLYHDYVKSDAEYKKPTVIVGFEAKFNAAESWSESIKIMQSRSCPLFLASSTEQVNQNNIIMIKEILNPEIIPIFNKKNPFRGLAPHRNL
ncbi:hypothetical protein EAI_16856, partial [Harpegnathos saltator]